MQHVGLFFTILIVFINLWGLMLFCGFFLRDRWLALVAAPWLLSTAFFCIESIHGLGSLVGLGLFGTFVSVGLILLSAHAEQIPPALFAPYRPFVAEWAKTFCPRRLLGVGCVSLGAFAYAFLWRFAFPDIDGSSEKIADLAYISSYLPGENLPAHDAWLFPYLSTHYYSFQHFAAALMGRLVHCDPGTTYNLAFCLLVALNVAAVAGVVFHLAAKNVTRVIVIAAFVFGGTGATVLAHFTEKTIQPWSAMRYVGSAAYDREPVGPWLKSYADGFQKMDMPGEPFSYSIYLGDYHAPLSGYYLMSLGILAGLLWERTRKRRYAGIVGATLTWSILANTWTLPLQGVAVFLWLVVRRKDWKSLYSGVAAGALLVGVATFVYLRYFSAATAGYHTSFRLVAADQHTPPLLFCVFLFPTIVLAILSLFAGQKELRVAGFGAIALLVISEFVYVDDIYSGMYERFNTTLKWWPWVATIILLTCAPQLIERGKTKWMRVVGLIVAIYPSLYAFDLASAWIRNDKPSFGNFSGTGFLERDLASKLMLERLRMEKPGLVVERPTQNAFTNSACLPLFAGHHMWLGWLGHEQLWRGYREDLAQRQERLFRLYREPQAQDGSWLSAEMVDYILWYQGDDTAAVWPKMNESLSPEFTWVEIYKEPDGKKVGFWTRKE
ncbi:MAG TPA: DUF2298 domain-containing protein [Opitutaceae bacterium]|nr:DUF2298 domain-containing protein [Opitutaceae bacterium]